MSCDHAYIQPPSKHHIYGAYRTPICCACGLRASRLPGSHGQRASPPRCLSQPPGPTHAALVYASLDVPANRSTAQSTTVAPRLWCRLHHSVVSTHASCQARQHLPDVVIREGDGCVVAVQGSPCMATAVHRVVWQSADCLAGHDRTLWTHAMDTWHAARETRIDSESMALSLTAAQPYGYLYSTASICTRAVEANSRSPQQLGSLLWVGNHGCT